VTDQPGLLTLPAGDKICRVPECPERWVAMRYCWRHYQQWRRTGDPIAPPRQAPAPVCKFPECTQRARSLGWCSTHYGRWRKHGDPAIVLRRPNGAGAIMLNGRIRVKARTHPLADANGDVYMHRKVLYDAIGPGPHPCHWCGQLASWGRTIGGTAELFAVQLDGNYLNVDITNIAPACPPCTTRYSRDGIHKRMRQSEGERLTHPPATDRRAVLRGRPFCMPA